MTGQILFLQRLFPICVQSSFLKIYSVVAYSKRTAKYMCA